MVLTGANGAGKTNLLEALSFLVPGRGLRRAKLSDVGRKAPGESDAPWAVAATVLAEDGEVALGTGISAAAPEKRTVRIAGEDQRAQSALTEYLSMQWLTPQMDGLFIEGASGRRRFLDRLIYGRDPAHAGRVSAYEHAMRERMKLLKDQGAAGADPAWLQSLEDTMATKGIAIATARLNAAGALVGALDAAANGPFPAADLAVEGDVEAWVHDRTALEAEDSLKTALKRDRVQDASSGRTATGPHRSDLRVYHRDKGLPADQCSTGEQKALLISLILAEGDLDRIHGPVPLLLLDEVVAHLDEDRRDALFQRFRNRPGQIWMTGTDPAPFAPLRDQALFVHVENATLTPFS